MRAAVFGLTCLAVFGCTTAPPVPAIVEVYRNPSAQIASQTDVTAARMAGSWVVRQGYVGAAGVPSTLDLEALPGEALQFRSRRSVCRTDLCVEGEKLVLLEKTGPGRWMPQTGQAVVPQGELWVLWMDFDSRTAAIGTPDGRFGWIMDKAATGGDDRITAAREIMDWFGYDMARLVDLP